MPSSLTIAGVTFTNSFAKAMPAIAGLQTMAFWGTGYDNINGNRVPGGPALTAWAGTASSPPTYSSNYVTLGQVAGPGFRAIMSNVPRAIASGWTWGVVSRVPASGAGSPIMGEYISDNMAGGSYCQSNWNVNSGQSNQPTMALFRNIATLGPVIVVSSLHNWHFQAVTYTGGAAGNWQLYDLTDGLTSPTYVAASMATGTQSVHFGVISTNDDSAPNTADFAFGMVANSVQTLPQLQAIYASVQSLLGRRGIVC